MRLLSCFVFLLLLGTFAPVRVTPPDPPPPVSFVVFEPVAAQAGAPGRLLYLGGWNMESNDWRFGGISAMHVARGEVLAFSDSGWMIRFPVPNGAGRVRADIAALPQGPGSALNKKDRDIESMAAWGRYIWLGFERRNGVWRFARPTWRADGAARPPLMREWEDNIGAEAMVRLRDGRFIVFAEGQGGLSDAAFFFDDPASPYTRGVRMRYRPPEGYRITDAALLPDGRLLLLHRRFKLLEGASAKLAVAEVPVAESNATFEAREIATLRGPFPVDNMEALGVTRENGRTIVWIASDDNYMPLQRSLLLKFALEG